MKLKEIQNKDAKEHQKMLAQAREKLRDTRFRVAAKQLKDVREIRKIRKQVALILTVLSSKKREKHA